MHDDGWTLDGSLAGCLLVILAAGAALTGLVALLAWWLG